MSRRNILSRKQSKGNEKIARLLEYLGLKSKVALAEYLGKSAQAINSAQARQSIPETWIDRIAAKQGCSPTALRKFVDTGSPIGQEKDYNSFLSSEPRLREIVDIWQILDLQRRDILQEFAKAISHEDKMIHNLLTHQVQAIAELLRYKRQDLSSKIPPFPNI
jgi:hypothetical protein